MSNVQQLTITETLAQVPTKLGFLPRESFVILALSDTSRVRMIFRVDLTDLATASTRADTVSTLAVQFEKYNTAGIIVGVYSEGGHTEHAVTVDATVTALSEHVASTFVNYVTDGIVTDSDGTNARIVDQDPVTDARVIDAPTADAIAKARRVEARLWPAEARHKALERTLTLLKACTDGTYPNVVTPGHLGAVAALATSITGRDALVMAVTDSTDNYDLARRLLADPSTPGVREALGNILGTNDPSGPEGVKPNTDAVRAIAVMLWDAHAHAKTPPAKASILSVLAVLAFWHNDTAAARTYARDAINEAEATPTFGRLAELIAAAVQAGLNPGWVSRIG